MALEYATFFAGKFGSLISIFYGSVSSQFQSFKVKLAQSQVGRNALAAVYSKKLEASEVIDSKGRSRMFDRSGPKWIQGYCLYILKLISDNPPVASYS
jgi:hypothetical protein